MDAILHGQQAEPIVEDTSARPDWLPEKFFVEGKPNYEALAKSYAELEKKNGAAATAEAPDAGAVVVDPAVADPNGEAAKAAVEKAGLKFDEFTAEWAEKGELTEASYEKLAQAGIPKTLVDQYIAGQKSLTDSATAAATQAVFAAAGGEDAYKSAVEWAATNMSVAEKKAFNAVLDGNDVEQMKLAVSGLVVRARKSGGIEPNNIQASSGAGDSGYDSLEQMVSDMQNPKYERDAAFRAAVARKVAASKNI